MKTPPHPHLEVSPFLLAQRQSADTHLGPTDFGCSAVVAFLFFCLLPSHHPWHFGCFFFHAPRPSCCRTACSSRILSRFCRTVGSAVACGVAVLPPDAPSPGWDRSVDPGRSSWSDTPTDLERGVLGYGRCKEEMPTNGRAMLGRLVVVS